MALGLPMPPPVLSEDEVEHLQALASSRSLPHSIVQRAQIVLAFAAGQANTVIAKRMELTGMTVGKWRKRYREHGLEAGLFQSFTLAFPVVVASPSPAVP